MKIGKILLPITKRTFVSYCWLLQLVLLKTPIESGTNKFWKLNISAYGLCDASHSWYLSLNQFFWKQGQLKITLMIPWFLGMIRVKSKVLRVTMLIFVEVWTKQFKLTIINKALKIIKETFLISHKEPTTFKCLEPNIKET